MANKKALVIPLLVNDLVSTPPAKSSGHRLITDLDNLALVADDAILIVHYGGRTYKTTKSALLGSSGKIYLTESALLNPLVDGVIEYNAGHLYFTDGDRYALIGSAGVKTTTTTVENTVTETTVYSHTFPANTLHLDMRIVFSLCGAFAAASASETLTIRYKLAGTTLHTEIITPTNGANTAWKAQYNGTVRSTGATGTLIDFSEFLESGVAPLFAAEFIEHTIDTTTAALYEVTVQWGLAKAGNSFSCTQGDLTFKH